jgi:predicted metal-dependent hydrolase
VEQFDFFFPPFRRHEPAQELLQIGSRSVPLQFVRNDAARRYILRVGGDGSARVTVPRRGSLKAAREFLHRHLGWIAKQLQKRETQPPLPTAWTHGTEIFFRGEKTRLQVEPDRPRVQFAGQSIPVSQTWGDLRPPIERHLRRLAAGELVPRTWELASLHQLSIQRVSVRDQRSRWGSCSVKKTISLNWRLIQTPAFVSDYIILHELMHLREMNHSPRFWRQVEGVCPDYGRAEGWLKQHARLLK